MTSNEEYGENKEGMILEIQRMSTEDGPGIRTTVFMKGCSLGCTWCHNPESISFKPQIQWMKTHCIGCGICIDVCRKNALSFQNSDVHIDREKCTACGSCQDECPSGAIEIIGSIWSEDELLKELLKDRAYFEKSSGGITVSGGEPGMQADFVSSLLKRLQFEGIHTAFDTCGMYSGDALNNILPYTNMVLFDLKEIDPEKHKAFTGKTNERIMNNLKFINDYRKNHLYPESLWIRTPIIPDATATEENISGIGKYLVSHSIKFDRWELCSFNNLCNNKYERLGLTWHFRNHGLLDDETMDKFLAAAKKSSDRPQKIIRTGSVRSHAVVDYGKITADTNSRDWE